MNSYDETAFKEQFDLHWRAKIQKVFGNHVDYNLDPVFRPHGPIECTPRQWALNGTPGVFYVAVLYYLNFLLEKDPKVITDIGCGENLFKKLISNIHGINPTMESQLVDELDFFDEVFSRGHTDAYESVFSINAVHFVSLMDFEKRILEFYNIVKPGGRGFVTFNTARMLEHTSTHDCQHLFATETPTTQQLTQYVKTILSNLSINFLVTDVLIDDAADEIINGNIRLVFEK